MGFFLGVLLALAILGLLGITAWVFGYALTPVNRKTKIKLVRRGHKPPA
jgi:hypothetical protein